MTTPSEERYPQSDPRGDAIPFDIGFPYGIILQPIGLAASAPVDIPTDAMLAVLSASCDCVVSFGSSTPSAILTEGVFLEGQVFIPAGGLLSIQVPEFKFSCISADGTSTGKLRMCLFKAWQALGKSLLGSHM